MVGVLEGLDGSEEFVFGLVFLLDGCLQLHDQLLTVGSILFHFDLLIFKQSCCHHRMRKFQFKFADMSLFDRQLIL